MNDLTLATSSAEAQSATHERALDRLAADQKRMEEVLDWYEAFINAQERAPAPVDVERDVMLGRLLGASERVDEMVRGAEEMVGVLNKAGERMRGVGGPVSFFFFCCFFCGLERMEWLMWFEGVVDGGCDDSERPFGDAGVGGWADGYACE